MPEVLQLKLIVFFIIDSISSHEKWIGEAKIEASSSLSRDSNLKIFVEKCTTCQFLLPDGAFYLYLKFYAAVDSCDKNIRLQSIKRLQRWIPFPAKRWKEEERAKKFFCLLQIFSPSRQECRSSNAKIVFSFILFLSPLTPNKLENDMFPRKKVWSNKDLPNTSRLF